MPAYSYQALNAERRRVTGEIDAENLAQALALLEGQGLIVQAIAAREDAAVQTESLRSAEQTAWQQQITRVLERGRELLPPLRAFAAELPPGRRREPLERLIAALANGDAPNADAVLRTLPGYWLPLLGAATASRDPGRIFREFLRESQQAEDNRRQWRLTLAYPLMLLGLAAVLLIAFSYLVVPVFRSIFLGFGIRIPASTLAVLTIAEWITSGRIVLVALIAAVVGFALVRATRLLSPTVRHWWEDRFALVVRHSAAVARLTQFTADLLEAELPPQHALSLAGLAAGSPPLERAAARFAARLAGTSAATSVQDCRLLTHTVLFVFLAEQSNAARIRLLREISANHAERIRQRLSWTRGLIEPLAICLIGLIVGGMAMALFFPLFNLLQALSF